MVKGIFLLKGNFEDDANIQPEGFEVMGKELMECRLKKILYGLK